MKKSIIAAVAGSAAAIAALIAAPSAQGIGQLPCTRVQGCQTSIPIPTITPKAS